MRKLRRPRQGRVIAGVAVAFADFFGIDVAIVRIIWLVLLLPGWLPGFIPYLICWIAIPEAE